MLNNPRFWDHPRSAETGDPRSGVARAMQAALSHAQRPRPMAQPPTTFPSAGEAHSTAPIATSANHPHPGNRVFSRHLLESVHTSLLSRKQARSPHCCAPRDAHAQRSRTSSRPHRPRRPPPLPSVRHDGKSATAILESKVCLHRQPLALLSLWPSRTR